jgi:HD-GYP domain-containing protein (c-di-GMP phosphodiesterase class II)
MISLTLHEIHPATILPQSLMGFNVYLSNGEGERPVKFLSSEKMVDEADYDQLRENSNLKVFIDATSLSEYREYLVTHSSKWLTDERLPSRLRTALLLECLVAKWQPAFSSSTTTETSIDLAKQISEQLVLSIEFLNVRIPDVIQALDVGVDLARHSLRTSVYCGLLGHAMGYDGSVLNELCMGGLLHDIGKQQNGESFKSSVTENDRMMRSHPLFGFRRLCNCHNVPTSVLMMCYQHHENIDGSGFPVRLIGDEIHFAAKICAIVNRFDHLTSSENPRMAYTPGSAGRIMEQDRSNRFDQEIMKTWLKLLKSHLKSN